MVTDTRVVAHLKL
jgi:hypothetical protein